MLIVAHTLDLDGASTTLVLDTDPGNRVVRLSR
jgi:hypothetical protein